MTATTPLQEYREQIEGTDRRTWLGKLTWFAVSETHVAHADLSTRLADAGLSEFCPPAPKDKDVFRRVFYNGQRRRAETDTEGVFENVLVREISHKDGKVLKRVVIETVDTAGAQLGYREAAEVLFDGDVRIRPLGGVENARGWALAQELGAAYQEIRGTVDSRAIREIVRQVLASAMAILVRPGGGVYFVPMQRAEMLDALEQVAGMLPGCMVHSLPLISEAKQCDMLRKAFEAETTKAVDETVFEITELVKAGKPVSTKQFGALSSRYKQIVARTQEYKALLEDTLDQTEERLHIFGLEIANLMSKVG